ncbi:carbohydrate ABC transporter permease [Anaeromicropila herbilytica]|uniref:Transporter n=1 Tax=Anaeromicropila herbilytica TaxID=2785025 RepID=A0A7R7EI51_9FIRM|nr:carbohydrate ABC transporter permease [Anaeromicropila herbilytica]BCN29635.1 transporter [Anaeromicropila herbilytica]
MELIEKMKQSKDSIKLFANSSNRVNEQKKLLSKTKRILLNVLRFILIVGISYIILSPLITIISRSFFSAEDVYNPLVLLLPINPTLENFRIAASRMSYVSTLTSTIIYVLSLMLIQLFICSMVGYGFARFNFPFKKLLFACVIFTIIIPTHTIMLPIYMHFRKFDLFGLVQLFTGKDGINLLSTRVPMYIMTIFGCGLRSGLYIYIFNQFFRGLPKEIEEAAFIDGAGSFYTYFRIMLVNAIPSIITVSVFSIVWQYNDMFYSKLFSIKADYSMSIKISTLQATIQNMDKITDPKLAQIYLYAGIVLTVLPVVLMYIGLQKYFMEGVERSGIVG